MNKASKSLFDSLEGVLNGHSKSTHTPKSGYLPCITEKAVARMGVKSTGYKWSNVIGIAFGFERPDGEQSLNAVYLTEKGVSEYYDLSLRKGYHILSEKANGLIQPIQQLIKGKVIKQVLSGFSEENKRIFNLSNVDDEPRILVLYVNKEKMPKIEEQSSYYIKRYQL